MGDAYVDESISIDLFTDKKSRETVNAMVEENKPTGIEDDPCLKKNKDDSRLSRPWHVFGR